MLAVSLLTQNLHCPLVYALSSPSFVTLWSYSSSSLSPRFHFPSRSLQPIRNNDPWMLLFFISFLLIVSFFVLNMFVGVVVENFHKCRQQQEEEEARLREEKRQKRLEKRRRSEKTPGEGETVKDTQYKVCGHLNITPTCWLLNM